MATLPPLAADLRRDDRERYLLSLFYPPCAREQVWAIEAFAAEIARIPDLVSEEMLGHIRLAWWREAIDALYAGKAAGHPVTLAMAPYIAERKPPRLWFDAMLEARSEQIESPRLADLAGYRRFHLATSGMRLRLATRVVTADAAMLEQAGAVGQCFGMVRGWTRLRRQLAAGEVLLPLDRLAAHGVSPAALLAERPESRWQDFCGEMAGVLREEHRRLAEAPMPPVVRLHWKLTGWWLDRLGRTDPLIAAPRNIAFLPARLVLAAILTKS